MSLRRKTCVKSHPPFAKPCKDLLPLWVVAYHVSQQGKGVPLSNIHQAEEVSVVPGHTRPSPDGRLSHISPHILCQQDRLGSHPIVLFY